MKLQRYECHYGFGFDGMREKADGEYVLYDEAQAEIATLRAENDRLTAMVGKVKTRALDRYKEAMAGDHEPDPVARLRFFCSLAMMNDDDWMDLEPFLDDVEAVVGKAKQVSLTDAVRAARGGDAPPPGKQGFA